MSSEEGYPGQTFTTPLSEEDQKAVSEILKRKTGVMIAVPNLGSKTNTALTLWLQALSFQTVDIKCPYFFKTFTPNDLEGHEWARNQCVREFLKDGYYKRLWFVDSDMIPPPNALDLLEHDEPIVSGMTYIWCSEVYDQDGSYRPPMMKINAFDYRHETDDFMSKIPPNDGKPMYADACGMACCVLRRDLIMDMAEPWFRKPRDPYGHALRSEDLDFCLRANQKGHKVLYLPTVQFGHAKELDLKQVVRYGICCARDMKEKLEAGHKYPEILFPGEKRKEPESAEVPRTLEVVGGRN